MRLRTILVLAAAAMAIAAAPADHSCVDLADLPAPAAPPPYAVLVACDGIRPGAYVETVDEANDHQSGCSLNFVFRGGDGGTYVGTAGHCAFADEGPATTWAPGTGPIAFDSDGQRIGQYAFGIDEDVADFALIRVDAARLADVDPGMCHFGGPTGMATDLATGTVVHHFGQGLAYGMTVPGRSGAVTGYFAGSMSVAGTATFGDSGSGVMDADGNAVGVLVRLSPYGGWEATDLVDHVGFAEAALGIDLELVTAPFEA